MGMDMLKGLATTLRELGKKPTTVSYPEEKRELPARYRGRHVLHRCGQMLQAAFGLARMPGSMRRRSVSESAGAAGARERHPNIRRAANALRAARTDLQHAAHDYCGHRVEALEATNAALNQLGLALKCDRD